MAATDPDFVEAVRRESARFVGVLRDADPGARVPACPDWDADDLLWHLGGVQWFWASIVEDRLTSPDGLHAPRRPPSHEELVAFAEEQAARLADALAGAGPDEPVYMWAADRTAGYVRRRQAHEALIHRLDAELTVGDVTSLDPVLASDGVHEALDVMFGGCPDWGRFAAGDTHVEVRVEETGLVVPVVLGRFTGTDPATGTSYDEDGLSVRAADPSSRPAVTVSGRAEDLDAWLWHRRDDRGITVTGDPAAAARLVAVLAESLD